MYFSTDVRPKLKEEHPEAPTKELSKMLGDKWGKMSDEENNRTNTEQRKINSDTRKR